MHRQFPSTTHNQAFCRHQKSSGPETSRHATSLEARWHHLPHLLIWNLIQRHPQRFGFNGLCGYAIEIFTAVYPDMYGVTINKLKTVLTTILQIMRDRMMQIIRRLAGEEGIGIMLIEHAIELVMAGSDVIVVLSSGEVIAEGVPEEIRQNREVLEAYLGHA